MIEPSTQTDTANDPRIQTGAVKQDYCDFCGTQGKVYCSAGAYRILRCGRCGLIWTDPLLDQAVTLMFEDVYKANEAAQKDRFRKQLKMYLSKAKAGNPRNLRILEVGSGLGFFLDVCEEFGIQAEGCDIAENSILYANRERKRVRWGTLDGYYAGKNFDAIFAFNLIEHLPHPKQFLIDADRALKPGGTLVLETPIQEGLFHRVARLGALCTSGRLNFYGLRPSGHIYKFSKSTFPRLRGVGNWKPVYSTNVPSPWGEIWGNSSRVESDHNLLYRFALPLVYGVANMTGQGNRLFVALQKA